MLVVVVVVDDVVVEVVCAAIFVFACGFFKFPPSFFVRNFPLSATKN